MKLRTILSLYFLATFLQAGTYGLTFLLPLLFEAFAADAKDVGSVLFSTTISTLLTVLYMGHITSRLGRLNTLGLASGQIAASLFIFGQATSFGFPLFVAGILLGSGWGLFYVLTPIVLTEITEKSERIKIFTLLSVFIMAGFGLSPVFGAILVESGFRIDVSFTVTALLCLISGAIFLCLRRPIAVLSSSVLHEEQNTLTMSSLMTVMRSKAARPVIMVGLGASVFAAISNFQTIFAEQNALDYQQFFLAYTATVIVLRILCAKFVGGRSPYAIIAVLLGVMTLSIVCFIAFSDNNFLYITGAILFGLGYGVSYPIIKAMAANDADPKHLGQTLQLFGLSYFIGVFGFPFIAGWIITANGIITLFILAAGLALSECLIAGHRYLREKKVALK